MTKSDAKEEIKFKKGLLIEPAQIICFQGSYRQELLDFSKMLSITAIVDYLKFNFGKTIFQLNTNLQLYKGVNISFECTYKKDTGNKDDKGQPITEDIKETITTDMLGQLYISLYNNNTKLKEALDFAQDKTTNLTTPPTESASLFNLDAQSLSTFTAEPSSLFKLKARSLTTSEPKIVLLAENDNTVIDEQVVEEEGDIIEPLPEPKEFDTSIFDCYDNLFEMISTLADNSMFVYRLLSDKVDRLETNFTNNGKLGKILQNTLYVQSKLDFKFTNFNTFRTSFYWLFITRF